MLTEQIQIFESLLVDKTGREIAYRRMHSINKLIREIDSFVKLSSERSIRDVVMDYSDQLGKLSYG